MKQTAVKWLEMQIVQLEKDYAMPHKIYELCEQAKAMEKQQIVDAWNDVYGHIKNAEQYYNETYKQEQL